MARQMKKSGIEWIGEIPSNWETRKNKYLLNSMYSGGTPSAGNEDFYAVGEGIPFVSISDMSLTPYVKTTKKSITESGRADKNLEILPVGTILYSIYATVGAVSELAIEATISQAMLALDLKASMDKQYYKYCLSSMKEYILGITNGNTQFNLNAEKVWNFSFPFPMVEEQRKIADFLDAKCAEIDAVIAKTKATIEEYKKLKQSIITEAVTKGIRGNRPMKDSGIEWIGDIPADWQVSPLQYYVELNKSTLGEDTPADYEFDYVEIGAVTLENGIFEYQRYKFADAPSRARRVVQPNDIIISTVRTYLKAIAIVPEKENVVVSTGFAVLTPQNVNIEYLGFALKSEYFVHTVTANSVGISYPAINSSDLVKFKIAIPTKEEQEEIAEYLGKKCAEMDTLIAKKTALLAEMEDYKKSVIYEYVTGKKEVL